MLSYPWKPDAPPKLDMPKPWWKQLLDRSEPSPLSDAELIALLPDDEAQTSLVVRHLPIIARTAGRIYTKPQSMRHDDLIQYGVIGLLEAAGRYDPTRKNTFLTYAIWYIRKEMLNALRRTDPMIRVPIGQGLHPPDWVDTPPNVTLPDECGTFLELIPAPDVEDPLLQRDRRRALEEVRGLMRNRRERVILEMRHLRDPRATLSEVGRRLNLSRERIRQIDNELISRVMRRVSASYR